MKTIALKKTWMSVARTVGVSCVGISLGAGLSLSTGCGQGEGDASDSNLVESPKDREKIVGAYREVGKKLTAVFQGSGSYFAEVEGADGKITRTEGRATIDFDKLGNSIKLVPGAQASTNRNGSNFGHNVEADLRPQAPTPTAPAATDTGFEAIGLAHFVKVGAKGTVLVRTEAGKIRHFSRLTSYCGNKADADCADQGIAACKDGIPLACTAAKSCECGGTSASLCGNGKVDHGELCDGTTGCEACRPITAAGLCGSNGEVHVWPGKQAHFVASTKHFAEASVKGSCMEGYTPGATAGAFTIVSHGGGQIKMVVTPRDFDAAVFVRADCSDPSEHREFQNGCSDNGSKDGAEVVEAGVTDGQKVWLWVYGAPSGGMGDFSVDIQYKE